MGEGMSCLVIASLVGVSVGAGHHLHLGLGGGGHDRNTSREIQDKQQDNKDVSDYWMGNDYGMI